MSEDQSDATPKHSVSVAAAVFDEAREHVLLIKRRDNGRWEPPGGVLELREPILDGVQREVLEETGAHILVENLTGVYKNLEYGIVALVFRASITHGEPANDSPEASEIRWWHISQVPTVMSPAFAARIRDALSSGPASIRSHDGVNMVENGRGEKFAGR